jgi:tetratricopeptide (TPR) repeat protein
MKGLLIPLALVAALPVAVAAADASYDLNAVGVYYRAFAQKYGAEKEILKSAAAAHVAKEDFPSFYRRKARARMDEVYSAYNAAFRKAMSNPAGTYESCSSLPPATAAAPDSLLLCAMAAQLSARPSEALAGYNSVITIQPGIYDGIAYYWRGTLYSSVTDDAAAAADFTSALKIMPGLPQALEARSLSYERLGYYSLAAADLAEYFKSADPSPLQMKARQGEACELLSFKGYKIDGCADLRADGDYMAATSSPTLTASVTEAWEQVKSQLKGGADADADATAKACWTVALSQLANADHPLVRIKTALYLTDKIIALRKVSPQVYSARAMMKYHLAEMRAGYYIDALDDFTQAILLDNPPDRAWDWLMEAYIYEKYDDLYHALGALDAAITSDPSNIHLYLQRTKVRLMAGDLPGAREDMGEFFKRNPSNPSLNEKVAAGEECKTLSEQGYQVKGCQPREYFAAGGKIFLLKPEKPPLRFNYK